MTSSLRTFQYLIGGSVLGREYPYLPAGVSLARVLASPPPKTLVIDLNGFLPYFMVLVACFIGGGVVVVWWLVQILR